MQPGGVEPEKSYSSALCLIPERSVWRQLQEIRCFKDKVKSFGIVTDGLVCRVVTVLWLDCIKHLLLQQQ